MMQQVSYSGSRVLSLAIRVLYYYIHAVLLHVGRHSTQIQLHCAVEETPVTKVGLARAPC